MGHYIVIGYQWCRYSTELNANGEAEGWSEIWNFETKLERCPEADSYTQIRCVYALV